MHFLAKNVSQWWNRLFPPQTAPSLSESRKLLSQMNTRARAASESYNQQIRAKARLAKRLGDTLEHKEEQVQARQKKKTDKMTDAIKRQQAAASGNVPDDSSDAGAPATAAAPVPITENWQYLINGSQQLTAKDYGSAKQQFLTVINAHEESKTPEQQAWALFGCYKVHRTAATATLEKDCQPTIDFLTAYHTQIQNKQTPPAEQGRAFFGQLEACLGSMKEYHTHILPAKKYLQDLTALTFGKDNNLMEDEDLVESLSDAQILCQSEFHRLNEFTQNLESICQARKNWLQAKPHSGQKAPAEKPSVDYTELLVSIKKTAEIMQIITSRFEESLTSESERLQAALHDIDQ